MVDCVDLNIRSDLPLPGRDGFDIFDFFHREEFTRLLFCSCVPGLFSPIVLWRFYFTRFGDCCPGTSF